MLFVKIKMKLSKNFIEDYVKIVSKPEDLATKLTLSGTKVEKIEKTKDDLIFEFELTPNRGDCFGVIGIAREISALTGEDLKELDTSLPYLEPETETEKLILEIKDPELCSHYALGVFHNVSLGESPRFIQDRLSKSGIRPINNIVDVTNYVMLETGIPSHAFDYDRVIGGHMTLRGSKSGEIVTTLDGVKRNLPAGAIIIEDREKLIDLAGLMGGENSAINPKTAKVALLVPIYNPVSIRRASIATGLRTEASNRFEKNLDPLAVKDTFYRIGKLLFETSGAKLGSPPQITHLKEIELKTIEITLSEIEDYLGITVLGEDLVSILTPLGFLVKHLAQEATDRFSITAPSYRNDIFLKVDIIEEIARIYGYNNFPKTLPSGELPTHSDSFTPDWERVVKEKLASLGLNEVMGYTLLSEDSIKKAGFEPEKTLKIINPNSLDFVYLRPSLLPGNLLALERNLADFKEVRLFEIGKVFSNSEKSLPNQDRQLSIISNQGFGFLKGVVEILTKNLNLDIKFSKKDFDLFTPGECGEILLGKESIGQIGSLNKEILAKFNIDRPVDAATIDFEKLVKLGSLEKVYTALPKFPEIKEDLSIVVDTDVETQAITDLIGKTGKPLLKETIPFDQYTDSKLGANKKSITFSLSFAADKTLTNEEVAKVREKIIKELKKTLNAEIR